MACPYFIPEDRCEAELWQHRGRLPLGDAYSGKCSAPSNEHTSELVTIENEALFGCNLGYANCSRLPADRIADCVRFVITHDEGESVTLAYDTEREHHPVSHGTVEYNPSASTFAAPLDPGLQKLAEAFLRSYFASKGRPSRYAASSPA